MENTDLGFPNSLLPLRTNSGTLRLNLVDFHGCSRLPQTCRHTLPEESWEIQTSAKRKKTS